MHVIKVNESFIFITMDFNSVPLLCIYVYTRVYVYVKLIELVEVLLICTTVKSCLYANINDETEILLILFFNLFHLLFIITFF